MEVTVQIEQLASPEFKLSSPSVAQSLTLTRAGEPAITLQVGQLAPQADITVWASQGLTRLLVTLTIGDPPARADFRPITVDYYERASAVNAIPGNFQRREMRQNDHEIRISRLIDRALRPLFDSEERREIHLGVQALSVDPELDLFGLAITAAGLAAQSSPLPFAGPIIGGAVGIHVDPESAQLSCVTSAARDQFEWIYATHHEGIVMLEGGSREGLYSGSALLNALQERAREERTLLDEIARFAQEVSPSVTPYISTLEVLDHPAFDASLSELAGLLQERDKLKRERRYQRLVNDLKREVGHDEGAVELTVWSLARAYLRAEVLEGRRQDGRAPHELREHSIEAGVLPRASGSCLISRGSTQVLVSATPGAAGEAPTYETLFSQKRPPLFSHYHFPGYATHQLRHGRAPNRREVGHGLLIQRALMPLFQSQRGHSLQLISDVLSSDGSSSMASVIGANIALAQAGQPLSAPIAGVSVGLVTDDEKTRAVLLLDITGDEDFYGDMDLKVVGGREGICAIQLDNKLGALPWSLIEAALESASAAHQSLLTEIETSLQAYQPPPQITREVEIDARLVGRVIGPRGSTCKKIERDFEVKVSVDAERAIVEVSGVDEDRVQAASEFVKKLGTPLQSGSIYEATIDGVKDFGVFVSFEGQSGLVHISELREDGRDAARHFKVGDSLTVMVLGTDQKGRLKLSHLATL